MDRIACLALLPSLVESIGTCSPSLQVPGRLGCSALSSRQQGASARRQPRTVPSAARAESQQAGPAAAEKQAEKEEPQRGHQAPQNSAANLEVSSRLWIGGVAEGDMAPAQCFTLPPPLLPSVSMPLSCWPDKGATSRVFLQATDPEILAYREHQQTAARISLAEEARTLVALGKCVGARRAGCATATAPAPLRLHPCRPHTRAGVRGVRCTGLACCPPMRVGSWRATPAGRWWSLRQTRRCAPLASWRG